MEPSSSPLVGHLRQRLIETYPKAKFASWSAIPLQQIHDGSQLAFGAPYETRIDLSKATVVCSLDADLIAAMPGTLPNMRAWAGKRDPAVGPMARLYAIETNLTVTGMNADHRLRMKPTDVQRFGLALLGRLAARVPALAKYAPLAQRFALSQHDARFADALAKDLARAGRGALVAVGPRQPPALHAAAHAINAALGSDCAAQAKPVLHDLDAGPRSLRTLAEELRAGKVDTLVITAWNPVYGAPFDLNFGKALSTVPHSIYRTLYADETAERAGWVIPALHPLESWGDARAHDGTVTFQQPLIAPLYAGATEVEVLAAFLGEGDRTAYTQLRAFWKANAPDDLTWEKWLADGFIDGTATKPETVAVRHDAVLDAALKVPPAETTPGLEINIVPDSRVWDGRFADVSWLQELPDPVTKITWENGALLSPATAAKLGLEQGDVVDLGLHGPPATATVILAPGHADDCVTAVDGLRPPRRGRAALQGPRLRHRGAPPRGGALVRPGPHRDAARPQGEGGADPGAPLDGGPRAGDLHHPAQAQGDRGGAGRAPRAAAQLPHAAAVPGAQVGHGHRPLALHRLQRAAWSPARRRTTSPSVGKEQVWRSREMHWLRIDRYFTGDDIGNPGVVFQPLMCVSTARTRPASTCAP